VRVASSSLAGGSMSHTTKAAIYFLITGVSLGGLLVTWGMPLVVLALINLIAFIVVAVRANTHVED
jgi:asparagine N-glycosylation enzyme membrane subunit Stt3